MNYKEPTPTQLLLKPFLLRDIATSPNNITQALCDPGQDPDGQREKAPPRHDGKRCVRKFSIRAHQAFSSPSAIVIHRDCLRFNENSTPTADSIAMR
ncbi:hypothetical protein Y032_0192g1344 [Ancylostoma ceylanicum]|nr:hypothetical protein Y032_0192g1344 [Ancylostoma ceylanicum]